jgi:hypothetical protein
MVAIMVSMTPGVASARESQEPPSMACDAQGAGLQADLWLLSMEPIPLLCVLA